MLWWTVNKTYSVQPDGMWSLETWRHGIIIIIIIKYIYIAQNRVTQLCAESTVSLQTKMSSVYVWMFPLKCLGLEGQQEDCSMSEVLVRRNYSRRNSSRFVERPDDQSAQIDAGCWRQTTAAGMSQSHIKVKKSTYVHVSCFVIKLPALMFR